MVVHGNCNQEILRSGYLARVLRKPNLIKKGFEMANIKKNIRFLMNTINIYHLQKIVKGRNWCYYLLSRFIKKTKTINLKSHQKCIDFFP